MAAPPALTPAEPARKKNFTRAPASAPNKNPPVAVESNFLSAAGNMAIQRKAAGPSAHNAAAASILGGANLDSGQCSCGGACDECKKKQLIQRKGEGNPVAVPSGFDAAHQELPYLDSIQRSFGHHDVTKAKAHFGSSAVEANRRLGALAFTSGSDIAFAGYPSLHMAAHEAAHVIQQRRGIHLKGTVGEVGDVYERHADQVADQVVRGESAELLLEQIPHPGAGGAAIQRKPAGDPRSGERIPIEQDPNWIYLTTIRIALQWLVYGMPDWSIDSNEPKHGKHHHRRRHHSGSRRVEPAQAEAQRVHAEELRSAMVALLTIMDEAAANRIPWETPQEALARVANAWWVALGHVEFVGDPEDPETIEQALPYVSWVAAADLAKLERLYDAMRSVDFLKAYEKVEREGGEKKEGSETETLGLEARVVTIHVAEHLAEWFADWFVEARLIAPTERLIMLRGLESLVVEVDPKLVAQWGWTILSHNPHELEKKLELFEWIKGSLKGLKIVGIAAAGIGAFANILEGVAKYFEQKKLFEELMSNEGTKIINNCHLGRETLWRLHEDLPPFIARNAAALGILPANYAFLALIEQYQYNDLYTHTDRPEWSGLFANTQAHRSEILAALNAYLDTVVPTATALAKWYKAAHQCTQAFTSAGLDILSLVPGVNVYAVIASVFIFLVKATGLQDAGFDWEVSFLLHHKWHQPAPYITVNAQTLFASTILTGEKMPLELPLWK